LGARTQPHQASDQAYSFSWRCWAEITAKRIRLELKGAVWSSKGPSRAQVGAV
jgi:hypothetical protein